MPPAARIEPMQPADVPAADLVTQAAFGESMPLPSESPEERERRGRGRIAHLLATDPGGAWVARDDSGRLVGAALALMRDGIWGLSLLVVDPGAQSAGIGRELLQRTLAYADDEAARGALILSSTDARALRAYARAGFALRPLAAAAGIVDRRALPEAPRGLRDAGADGVAVVDRVSRAVRGASHARDIPPMLDAGSRLLTLEDRGFVVHREGRVKLLAALDEEAARALLWAALAASPPGASVDVDCIAAGHDWAIEVALEARLDLSIIGALFVRGELGPLRPYLPSGAYL